MNWIPVAERLPTRDEMVLVFVPGWHMPVSCGENKGKFWSVVACIGSVNDIEYEVPVTHWMPLPEGPPQ